ncbi:PAS domain-containing hybrid sensor histidine kinase/response regulator [Yoonia algicola]|uniref:histidine kinase n=1 Tax=Yoonia algicola TaxID=3137368 RepID=A0AAN0M1C6_9RHOB
MSDFKHDALLFKALLDAMPDAVVVSDLEGMITQTNLAVGHLFGHDPAQLVGKSINILMPKALADRHDGFIQRYLETDQPRIMRRGRAVEGLRSDGTAFPLHASLGKTEHGGETYFIAILHDLSKRKAAEDALARSARVDAIGQMTSGISHDFSNILTVIIGNLELLEARIEGADNKEIISDAAEAAQLGAELTSRISAFARNTITHFDPTDVNEACDAATALIQRTFDPHHEIAFERTDPLPVVLADTTQLQSALINIALNARDAMPDGGKLVVRTETVLIDDSYMAQELDVAQGHYVRISVTDTGVGMGPDTQQKAFEPFFTTKPIGHGTGLGLAMVYGFVRQCGGHVAIYSEIGLGTTIALYFPILGEAPPIRQTAGQSIARHDARGQSVLVVEDNPQVRRLTTARLKELGYTVHESGSGDDATEILRRQSNIDAVFTDLVMPGEMDGLALARHIVATYPHIRILLTSGYGEDILKAKKTETNLQILRKPYRQSELANALSALFDRD